MLIEYYIYIYIKSEEAERSTTPRCSVGASDEVVAEQQRSPLRFNRVGAGTAARFRSAAADGDGASLNQRLVLLLLSLLLLLRRFWWYNSYGFVVVVTSVV